MTTIRFSGALTALVLASTSAASLAQAPKPAPAPAAAAGPPAVASAPPPGPPKPPAELDQIKWLEGSWRCDGKAPAGAMGPEHAYKSTMKVKRELDGFWYSGDYEQKKTKDNPMAVKARSFLGFDPVAKKVISLGVDNFGGALQLTGPIAGDKISTEGEGNNGGQKMGFKEVFTKTGDKSLTWHGELRMGKDWIVVGDDACKR
jgi:hypothetical protein